MLPNRPGRCVHPAAASCLPWLCQQVWVTYNSHRVSSLDGAACFVFITIKSLDRLENHNDIPYWKLTLRKCLQNSRWHRLSTYTTGSRSDAMLANQAN